MSGVVHAVLLAAAGVLVARAPNIDTPATELRIGIEVDHALAAAHDKEPASQAPAIPLEPPPIARVSPALAPDTVSPVELFFRVAQAALSIDEVALREQLREEALAHQKRVEQQRVERQRWLAQKTEARRRERQDARRRQRAIEFADALARAAAEERQRQAALDAEAERERLERLIREERARREREVRERAAHADAIAELRRDLVHAVDAVKRYPVRAVRRGQEGVVVVRVTVEVDGSLACDPVIVVPSDHDSLNSAAIDAVVAAMPLAPLAGAAGRVPLTFDLTIAFSLDE